MKPALTAMAVAMLLILVVVGESSLHTQSTSCFTGKTHTSDAKGDVLPLRFGGASSDLWNVGVAEGFTQMCYLPSGLSTTVEMTDIVPASSANQVIGYPNVGYGYGEFDDPFGRPAPGPSFPMSLRTLDDVGILASVNYSLSVPKAQPMDFAYDLWIEAAPQPGHRAVLTDLEVMVWLYNQTMQPAAYFRGTTTSAAVIDGRQTNATWLVYATPPSPCCRELVTYLLDPTMREGNISVQLRDLVDHAVAHYWKPVAPTYYLMGIELGTEFELSGSSGSLSWNVSSMEVREAGSSSFEMVANPS